jgi:hypothetical protein
VLKDEIIYIRRLASSYPRTTKLRITRNTRNACTHCAHYTDYTELHNNTQRTVSIAFNARLQM